jgi:ABC-type branched-subunit amino acid transport system substrate-binding protein
VKLTIRRAVSAAVLALGIAAAAAGARAAEPYTINVISPDTGSAAFLGKDYHETYRALEIAINRSGGIKGRPVISS